MRREDLIVALKRIRLALVESNALGAIMSLSRSAPPDREGIPSAEAMRALIEGFSNFSVRYERFGSNEKKVLAEFGLDVLTESSAWLARTRPGSSGVSLAGKIRYALETFPSFINLLERESENSAIVVATQNKKGAKSIPTRKVTFLIRETEAPTITLKDLFFSNSGHRSDFSSSAKNWR
jgi:hypothetical protein